MAESSFRQVPLQPLAKLPVVSSQEVAGFFDASTRLEAHARADFKNRDEAEFTRKGLIDGQKGEFTDLLYAPSVRGRNYTQAAQKAYLETIELNTLNKLAEITERNRNDSLTAQKEMEGYFNGVVQGMPKKMRERIGQTYLLKGQIKANALISEIQARERDKEDADMEASVVALDIAAARETPKYARGLASLDNDIRGKNLAALIEHWTDLQSRHNATMTDVNGITEPVFSEAQKLRSRELFLEDASDGYIKQSFRNAPDKDEYLKGFTAEEFDFRIRNEFGVTVIDLRPVGEDKFESLRDWMKSEIREINSARNTQKTIARKQINQLISNLKADGEVDDEQLANAKLLANQHGLGAEFNRLQSWEKTANKMKLEKTFSPQDRADAIQTERAVIEQKRKIGIAISKDDIEQLEAMEKLHVDMLDGEKKDPMATANRYGTVVLSPLELLNEESVTLRKAQAQTVRDKNGGPIVHYTRQEREDQIRKFSDKDTSAKDKIDELIMLGAWEDQLQAVAVEVSKDSPNLAHQVGLMQQGVPLSTHRLIFEGEEAFRNGQRFMSVKDTDAALLFDKRAAAFSLSGQTRANVAHATEAIYHALTFDEGGDTTIIDSDRLEKAIQLAAGATMEGDNPIGGIAEVRGRSIAIPRWLPGKIADRFFKRFTPEDFRIMAVDGQAFKIGPDGKRVEVDMVKELDVFDDAVFIPVDDGRYIIAQRKNGEGVYLASAVPDHELQARRDGLFVFDIHKLPSVQREAYLSGADSFFITESEVDLFEKQQAERRKEAGEGLDPGARIELDDTSKGIVEEVAKDLREFGGNIGRAAEEVLEPVKATVEELLDQAREAFKKGLRLADEFLGGLETKADVKTSATQIAKVFGLSPTNTSLFNAVIQTESGFRPDPTSKAGARGPAQIMPGTARLIAEQSNLGFTAKEILNDPAKNLAAGAWLLFQNHLPFWESQKVDKPKLFALAEYNSSRATVNRARKQASAPDEFDSIKKFLPTETRNYVNRVSKLSKG